MLFPENTGLVLQVIYTGDTFSILFYRYLMKMYPQKIFTLCRYTSSSENEIASQLPFSCFHVSVVPDLSINRFEYFFFCRQWSSADW